jgi:predicted PurR-regulated permease PerM
MDRDTTANILLSILAAFVIGVTLKAAEPVLVPVLVAMLLAYIMEPPATLLRRAGLPMGLAVPITALVIFGLVAWLVVLISFALADLARSLQRSQNDIALFLWRLESTLRDLTGMEVNMDLATVLREIGLSAGLLRFARLLGSSLAGLVVIFGLAVVILYGKARFPRKLLRAYPSRLNRQTPLILGRIDAQVRKYIGVKTLGSLLVGIVAAVTTLLFGLRFVPVWAALAFLLNFIPVVGPLVSSSLPGIIALISPGDPVVALSVFGVLIGLNMLIHNVLEPLLQGEVLDLSLITVFLSLLFWGWLWGHLGVLLAVPMTAAVKIVLESIPLTRPIAILLERPARRLIRRPGRPKTPAGP